MGFIFIMRHGPTKNYNIKTASLKKIIPRIAKEINSYGKIDVVITSPITRCVETSKMVMEYMKINQDKLIINDILQRVKKGESWDECHLRGVNIGKNMLSIVQNDNMNNILIITHSSILKSIVEGATGKLKDDEHLHATSLTIFNHTTKKLLFYNKGWKKY